jgi:DNA polymerase I-like protein with 3'-5' exonuclease and polymerase domains
MISLDTETTGIDFRHAARPFFVTVTYEDESQKWWEWEVNPYDRKPVIPDGDLDEIQQEIDAADLMVLQNPKFDMTALSSVIQGLRWDWSKVRDTLFAGHILATGVAHDLTSMVMQYLGIDIAPLEKNLEAACQKARSLVRMHLGGRKERKSKKKNQEEMFEVSEDAGQKWVIAGEDVPGMPSAKEKTWKFDTWLPRAVCLWAQDKLSKHTSKFRLWWDDYAKANHPWLTSLRDYSNGDSCVTLPLWAEMEKELVRRGLMKLYMQRLKLLKPTYLLEERGVTINSYRAEGMQRRFARESREFASVCTRIAAKHDYELKLPAGGNNKSLHDFVFQVLKLPVVHMTEGGVEALDKESFEEWQTTLPQGDQRDFVEALTAKRQRDTGIKYLEDYGRFWHETKDSPYCRLHPNVNPTGTITLRNSSNNPNSQNVGKKDGFNLRRCFGPAPGREWWSIDGENMELRVAAYGCGEEAFIALFEHPDDPPHYGSNHLLSASIVWPDEYNACVGFRENGETFVDGRLFKKKYAATKYDGIKRGDFALQYGAGAATVDKAFGTSGFWALQSSFIKQSDKRQEKIAFAQKNGFVETLPRRSVDPKRGYPIMVIRNNFGRIELPKPYSYHIQGTVSEWMEGCMVRCGDQLEFWQNRGFDGFITLNVHDELVFDFPKSRVEPEKGEDPNERKSNLWRALRLAELMEEGGKDMMTGIGCGHVPVRVSVEYHPDNWAEGIRMK